jgi:hypothetical protein
VVELFFREKSSTVGININMLIKNCVVCNNEIKGYPSVLKRRITCSKKCRQEYSFPRKMVSCAFCEKEFKYVKGSKTKFCSIACAGNYRISQTNLKIENNIPTDVTTIKRYLINKDSSCSVCRITNTWNNMPLTLQLDHIDGNSDNNNLRNLRLVCPNCHSQTNNFSGKGRDNELKTAKRNLYFRKLYRGD